MTKMQLDRTDQAIVRCLVEDARATYSEISKEIGVSVGTVRNRLSQLRESGTLHLNVWLDPNRAGRGVNATFLLHVESGRVSEVADALIPLDATGYIALVAGGHDLIVDVFCRDVSHLNDVLQNEIHAIDGVVSVTSYLVTEIKYESSSNIGGLLTDEE